MPKEERHKPTDEMQKMRENPYRVRWGDNVSSDHDKARYIGIYRHRRDILLNLRQETLEFYSEDDVLLVVAVGA